MACTRPAISRMAPTGRLMCMPRCCSTCRAIYVTDPNINAVTNGALRGLLEAYLATHQEAYRDQAIAVYASLVSRFWLPDLRCFATTQGSEELFQFTPLRFSLLSGALRQYYLLVASAPERGTEGQQGRGF